MKTYEYTSINIDYEIKKIRSSENPRQNEGDEKIYFEIVNGMGALGWRVLNPGVTAAVYFERETG